jgi:hypothetical protein
MNLYHKTTMQIFNRIFIFQKTLLFVMALILLIGMNLLHQKFISHSTTLRMIQTQF